MDTYLRRLQRLAQEDPSAQPRYIAALERVIEGSQAEDHPHLDDARIASISIWGQGLDSEVFENIDLLNPVVMHDADGNRAGWMIDVYWEDYYDFGDEASREHIEVVESQLCDDMKQLLKDAADLGYANIIFWK